MTLTGTDRARIGEFLHRLMVEHVDIIIAAGVRGHEYRTLKLIASIRDVANWYGIPFYEAEEIQAAWRLQSLAKRRAYHD